MVFSDHSSAITRRFCGEHQQLRTPLGVRERQQVREQVGNVIYRFGENPIRSGAEGPYRDITVQVGCVLDSGHSWPAPGYGFQDTQTQVTEKLLCLSNGEVFEMADRQLRLVNPSGLSCDDEAAVIVQQRA